MRDLVQLRVYCQLYKPVSSTIILIDKSMLYLPVKEAYDNVTFQI